jgi:hypothetical protein
MTYVGKVRELVLPRTYCYECNKEVRSTTTEVAPSTVLAQHDARILLRNKSGLSE